MKPSKYFAVWMFVSLIAAGCAEDADDVNEENTPNETDTASVTPTQSDQPSAHEEKQNDDATQDGSVDVGSNMERATDSDIQTPTPDTGGNDQTIGSDTGGGPSGSDTASDVIGPDSVSDIDATDVNQGSDTASDIIASDSVSDIDATDTEQPTVNEERSDQPFNTAPDISDEDYAQHIANMNAFGMDLFALILDEKPNVICSPVSIATALAMVYAGARNTTAAEMSQVMHNTLTDETFHNGYNRLMLDIASRNVSPDEIFGFEGEKSVEISMANATWIQESLSLLSTFSDLLAVHYDSGSSIVDFVGDPEGARTIINQWVEYKTRDRIKDLIPENMLGGSTRLVLTNAIYFKGSWKDGFTVHQSGDDYFYPLDGDPILVPTMYKKAAFSYAQGDNYQVVDLPYVKNGVSMTVLLPAEGQFDTVKSALSAEWLGTAFAALQKTDDIDLSMPKFKFTWGTEKLNDPLKNLGMIEAFSPSADFSGMTQGGGLAIDFVLHKGFVGVDEYGTEAAAATAIGMDAGMAAETEGPIVMAVNRPFFFFIRDATGAILFAAQVKSPNLSE